MTTTTSTTTTTFKGRTLKVGQVFPTTEGMKAEGLLKQYGVEGKKGALGLMQEWATGERRVVWLGSARTEHEYPTA